MKMTKLLVLMCAVWSTTVIAQDRTYYVSLVEKGSVKRFLNRLVTPNHHLVVTRLPVAGATESREVTLNSEEKLYIVEVSDGEVNFISEGEVARVGGFVLIVKHHSIRHPNPPIDPPSTYWEAVEELESLDLGITGTALPTILVTKTNYQISLPYIKQSLEILSGATETTIDGKPARITERSSAAGKALARQYLGAQFRAFGFQVSEHVYNGSKGVNLIAEKEGRNPSKILILSAHYDSVGNAGADDNASGTIGGLAIAQALSNSDLEYTLRIIAFDEEEKGLIGSRAYATKLNKNGELSKLLGVINMDMLGYDSDGDGAFHVMDCKENNSPHLTAIFMNTLANLSLALLREDYCTNRSDHASFWRYNIPAIIVSENYFKGDPNPCIHKRCDQVDLINYDYMQKLITAVANTAAVIVKAE